MITNYDGTNLSSGVVSTLVRGLSARDSIAVQEVDERALPRAWTSVRPDLVVLLNLTRDQLDRTGEVGFHVDATAPVLGLT